MRGPSPSEMQEAFVKAYREAAEKGAEMRAAANSIETIREMMAEGSSPYTIWAKFDESVGLADAERLMPVMVELSRKWEQLFTELETVRVKQAFTQNQEQGWIEWLEAYAASFDGPGWHTRFAMTLATEALQWSPAAEWPVERIRNVVGMVLRDRWGETYDWFVFLARQEALRERRALFLVLAAEIQLLLFEQPTKVQLHIEEAERIAKNDARIKRVQGELCMQRNDLGKAKDYFQQIIQQKPNDPDGFCNLGDVLDQAGDAHGAESQYQQAVANAPGRIEGYHSLLKFHGKPNWFKDRNTLLAPLVERMKALSELEEFVDVELGLIYVKNGLFEEGRNSYQQAIDIDERYLAVANRGYSYVDEAAGATESADALRAQARTAFARAIEVAPHAVDGYWGMTEVAIAEKNWASVLEWCDRTLTCHPEWESRTRSRRANALGQMGRLEEAEREVGRSLELERDNLRAANEYWSLIEIYHSTGKLADAHRVLELWHRLPVASEHLYQNELGNWSFETSEYGKAASHYRLALAAKADDAVLHSNLALALQTANTDGRKLEELTEAAGELRRALELNPQYEGLLERLNKCEVERAVLEAYGEKAAAFEPVVTPVRADLADMSQLLNAAQDDLSAATQAAIEGFRTQFREAWGITIPGIQFGILGDSVPGGYRVTLRGRQMYNGTMKSGTEPLTGAIEVLRLILEKHMGEFVGHDAAAEILKGAGTPAAESVLKDSQQLTRFVVLVRGLLARRLPVKSVDTICEAVQHPDALEQLTGAMGGAA